MGRSSDKTKKPNPEKLSNDVVISVRDVSKKFCRTLRRSMVFGIQDLTRNFIGLPLESRQLRKGEFWALKNISFELKKGEGIGLIGPNGSGKTTFLRLITGIFPPDEGEIIIKGRIGALIALGAGFHPHMTGIENIYLNGTITGMNRAEIDSRIDDIIKFSEIQDFIHSPVSSYSSGMRARLGFAIAIHTDPEILIIDEVLSVGDIRFKGKCFRKLAELKENGTSFILVSHNPHHIFQTCNSAMYLSGGKVVKNGDISSVINCYESSTDPLTPQNTSPSWVSFENKEKKILKITSVGFTDGKGNRIESPLTGKRTILCVECESITKIVDANLTLVLRNKNELDDLVMILSNLRDNKELTILSGQCEIQLTMPYLALRPSNYVVMIQVRRGELYMLDEVEFQFTVNSEVNISQCSFYQPRDWNVVQKNVRNCKESIAELQ